MGLGIIATIKDLAPIPIYLAILILSFLALFGKVRPALFLLTFLLPLQNVFDKLQQYPLGNDLNDILIICMVLGWFFSASMHREKTIQPTPFNFLLIIFSIYTYISLWKGSFFLGAPMPFSAADPRVQIWKNYMIFPLLFFITVNNIKNTKQLKWLFLIMVLSMLLMDYYTVNQVRYAGSIESRTNFHGTFTWLGPNEVAAFYVTYTFVLIAVFLSDKAKWKRILLAIVILQNLYCALFLFSRGAYLALAVGAIVMSLFKKKVLLVPIFLALIFWQTLLPPRVLERIQQTKTAEGEFDASTQRRIIMWNQSMDFFKGNMLMGAGFNIFPYMGFELGDTHNVFIKILGEQGLIGITIIIILFILAIKSSWKLYYKAQDKFLKGLGLGFLACIFAVITGNFFGDRWTYLPLGAFFWVFLGMVERGRIIAAEESAIAAITKKKSKAHMKND